MPYEAELATLQGPLFFFAFKPDIVLLVDYKVHKGLVALQNTPESSKALSKKRQKHHLHMYSTWQSLGEDRNYLLRTSSLTLLCITS